MELTRIKEGDIPEEEDYSCCSYAQIILAVKLSQ